MAMSSRSSLIGVAISLTGNTLISLALNCQKLAHLRLQQKAAAQNEESDGYTPSGDDEEGVQEGDRLLQDPARSYGAADPQGSPLRDTHAQQTGGTASTLQESDSPTSPSKSTISTEYLYSPLWWLGLGLMSLGELGNFLSYGFAPASLVAPLGAVALLANVLFAPFLLKERFRPSDLGGIFLAIIGAVTVVVSSKQSDNILDPNQLMQAISRKEFIAYCTINVVMTALLVWASTTRLGDRFILVDVGVCALFGGFTVLSTKGLSSLLSMGRPLDLLRYPISYVLVVVLVGTALAQVTFLNRALQRYDSREVIPTQFVSFTISAIVGSAVLYQDFADMNANRLLNFLFGCLTTFAGVLLLTNSSDDGAKDEGSVDEHVESPTASTNVAHPPRRNEEGTANGKAAARTRTSWYPKLSNATAHPIAVPRTHPAAANVAGRHSKRKASIRPVPLALAAESLPSAAIVPHAPYQRIILPSSLNDLRHANVVSARRSIFNPAFTIAYIDAAKVQPSSPRRGRLGP